MTDEVLTNQEAETSGVDPVVEDAQQELSDDQLQPGEEEGQAPPEDDSEEIEHEGEKFKVPKKLKDAFLMQADYTRKTQEVAEQRKTLEAERQAFVQRVQLQQATLSDHAQLVAIDNQLQQFARVDWNSLIDQDPIQAQKLDIQRKQLQEAKGALQQRITEFQQRAALEQQQNLAKLIQEGAATLQKEIPGWGAELQAKIKQSAVSQGYQDQEIEQVNDPRFVKLLHKAYLYDQLVAQKPKPPQQTQEKPVTRISANSGTAHKDPGKMTDKEFAAWRQKQIAQRR